jgi:chitin synthase
MVCQRRMYRSNISTAVSNTIQIVYVACVGPILLAALLEWFLWLAAFIYCLVKACRKADHWSQRFLAIALIVFFLLMR